MRVRRSLVNRPAPGAERLARCGVVFHAPQCYHDPYLTVSLLEAVFVERPPASVAAETRNR